MLCEDVLCLSRRTRRRWRKRVGPCQNRRSAEEVVQYSTRLKGHVSRSVRRPLVSPPVHALQGIVWVPTYLPTCRPDKRARQMLASARHASPRRTNRVTLCEGRAGTERAAATTTSIPTVNRGASGMRLHFASAFATNPTRPRWPLARWRLLKPPRRLFCTCSPCSMPSRHRDGHPLRRLTAFAGCLSPPPATPRLPSCC
jgi:hypothetical protein